MAASPRYRPAAWPWPAPALLAWLLAWLVFRAGAWGGLGPGTALAAAAVVGLACSRWGQNWWRRAAIGAGFPLSLLLGQPALGLSAWPAWAWLVPLAVLLLLYPVHAWRDAPVFPTAPGTLVALSVHAPLAPGARVLDAGCGAGHGLQALRAAYPQAALDGLEWSLPLCLLSALRCPWARVRRGNIWVADWSQYDLVYLFQRPESMTRARIKGDELRPGAWLVSLEFAVEALRPSAQYRAPNGKMVWLYQAPLRAA